MTETIPGTDISLTHNKLKWFELNLKKLFVIRKWLIIIAALNAIAAVVEMYLHGLTVEALFNMIIGFACVSASTKCETLILKMKIEEQLEGKF